MHYCKQHPGQIVSNGRFDTPCPMCEVINDYGESMYCQCESCCHGPECGCMKCKPVLKHYTCCDAWGIDKPDHKCEPRRMGYNEAITPPLILGEIDCGVPND